MTAPLYRLDPGAAARLASGDEVVLDGPEGHHAATVKRARVGEPILLADGGPDLIEATVTAVAPGRVHLQVQRRLPGAPEGPRFVLVQALAKGDRDLQALEAATELGVDEVVPWQAERCIVQWRDQRAVKAHAKWEALAAAAAKQARRPTVPRVAPLTRLDDLVRRVGDADAALVLHEDAQAPLAAWAPPAGGEVLIVVGPEGGITPRELDALASAGGRAVRLGPHVLRSSSAGPAALAVLNAAGRWR